MAFPSFPVQRLDYHAPERLCASLAGVLGPPRRTLDVLDAGCRTGLCGPLLRPHARSLSGVDLSSGTLAKANTRAIYDHLVEAEIEQFLDGHTAQFDVVASADTLCYFRDLMPAMRAAHASLRPDWWLAFTLERADDTGTHRINPHGR